MPNVDEVGLVVRLAAAVVWLPLLWRVLHGHTVGGTYLRRILITGSLTALLWSSAIRGLVSGDWTTVVITAASASCFIAGVTLLTADPAESQ